MKSRKFGFLKHYRKIKIEGFELSNIINKCIRNGIVLRNLHWKGSLESIADIQANDFSRLKKEAGHSYRMTVVKEGGAVPFLKRIINNKTTIAGAFLLGALLFYQNLFVTEIQVDGYGRISEESLRQTMKEAGLYEGSRKPEDYSSVKAALYRNHSEITWVSIYEDGRQIRVNIAEAGKGEEEDAPETAPVNIVAQKAGLIEKVSPLQGNTRVEKGDYVNKGDVLISGRLKYQSTDYNRGDGFFYMYSHAEGQVYARVPEQITFYVEKMQREAIPEGNGIPGLCIKFGDIIIDTTAIFNRHEVSIRESRTLIDTVDPLPLKLELVRIKAARIEEQPADRKQLEKVTEAALRQYAKGSLDEGEEIFSSTMEFHEMENVIKINVFMEVLEEIGEDKKIRVKK